MPTVMLKFKLPDELGEFEAARTGSEARSVLWHIDQRCRSILKHGTPTPEEAALAMEIRQMISDSSENLLD